MNEIEQVTTNQGRYYRWYTPAMEPEYFKSVTTILGATIPTPWLPAWKVKMAAQKAIDFHDEIGGMIGKKDKQGAIDFVKGSANRYRDDAADRGTQVHAAAEAMMRGQPVDYDNTRSDAMPYIAAFEQFLVEHKPEPTHIETTVASRVGMYAGQLDLKCTMKDIPVLIDIKTSSKVTDKMALQLAAYNWAEFHVVDGKAQPWEPVEWAAILHLRPSGRYSLVRMDAGEGNHRVFLAAREMYTWLQNNRV